MKTKGREYLTKAKRCEARATKRRCPEDREWQLILGRAYRMLAEMEVEAAALRNRWERSRTSMLVGPPTAAPVPSPAAPTSRAEDPAGALSGQAPRAA